MSGTALFLVGTLVTLITASALGLLVWGAILDGRDEAERRLRRLQAVPVASERVAEPPGPRRAA